MEERRKEVETLTNPVAEHLLLCCKGLVNKKSTLLLDGSEDLQIDLFEDVPTSESFSKIRWDIVSILTCPGYDATPNPLLRLISLGGIRQ